MTEHERYASAAHEAGHAVAAAALQMRSKFASIVPLARSDGRHRLAERGGEYTTQQLAVWALAGAEAERWILRDRDPRLVRAKAADDYAFVRQIVDAEAGPGEDEDALAGRYETLATALVITHEAWIKAVAARLLRDGTIDEDLILDLRPVA